MLITVRPGAITILLILSASTLVLLYSYPSLLNYKPADAVRDKASKPWDYESQPAAVQAEGLETPPTIAHSPDKDQIQQHEQQEQDEHAPLVPSKALGATTTHSSSISASTSADHEHYELRSYSTEDGKYFMIDFHPYPAINPNVIPHPKEPDTYIIVAQRHKWKPDDVFWFTEITCNAAFKDGNLTCLEPPTLLPVAATDTGKCEGGLAFLPLAVGPHDARVFWGPEKPYMIYGSGSPRNCFGQWIHDFRMLVSWPKPPELDTPFRHPTDLQRHPPYSELEKNYFAFWDAEGTMYVHQDVAPRRSFSKLNLDGSVGEDLALEIHDSDNICWEKLAPKILDPPHEESIHQGTNSLVITMCDRADPTCEKTEHNTYIMHIFQKKQFISFHAVYEPYVMLFKHSAPFGLYGISSRPLWIHGRKKPNEDESLPKDQSEMFYITSMNWKANGSRYSGYLDDELIIGFGIEDHATAGIDVTAAALLDDLALC